MRRKSLAVSLAGATLVLLAATLAAAAPATRVADAIWANDELFDTVVTDTSFMSPPLHSTDVIYSFMMSGLAGQRSVAEAAPGDADYNGGRWNVHIVTFTPAGIAIHDADGDGYVDFELTNEQQVHDSADLGHILISPANFYFECPLLPNRGRR
jgi:hypothetical protein